jgi:hypothetical protein
MKQFKVAAMILVLCTVPAIAQQWSSEQEEAWQFVVKETELWCSGNGSWETVHPDSVYWRSGDPAPVNKSADTRFYEAGRQLGYKCHVADAFPLSIVVEGEFAFVMYYIREMSQAPGEDKPSLQTVRWLDVLKKENGKWLWFTGYGESE